MNFALIVGAALALAFGNPWADLTKRLTRLTLAAAVVGLGAGMDLTVVGRVGFAGLASTALGIGLTFAAGILLGKAMGVGRNAALLVTAGTAICGGSAIAALAPIVRAKSHETAVALGTVFLLNAVALFVFPFVGHALGLDPARFGTWAALAIHDTSSVVGATIGYGPGALETGTTLKLTRALWIFPVAAVVAHFRSPLDPDGRPGAQTRYPWFILGFVGAAALATFVPGLKVPGQWVAACARALMGFTLFLVGAGITRETLRAVGFRPLAMGLVLWLAVAAGALLLISRQAVA